MSMCPCCGQTPAEPLFGCCESCAAVRACQRCASCGTWHHDDPIAHGQVVYGVDHLARCASGCT